MPNLLPLLALQPAAVIHLTTDKTAHRSSRILDAAKAAGVSPLHENVRLSSMPSIRESGRAVERAIRLARERSMKPVLNFTGGTKLMSIGAYEQAAKDQCPSFYVDTAERRFENGGSSPGLDELVGKGFSFQDLANILNLDVIVAANGHRSISSGRDWHSLRAAAIHLLEHPEHEELAHESLHGKKGLLPNGNEPRDSAGWLALIDRTFTLPATLLPLLVDAGLVRQASDSAAMLMDSNRNDLEQLVNNPNTPGYFSAVGPLQQTLAFLTGGWWEVVVADAMDRSGRFRDLRWSAEVTQQSGTRVEEDLTAIDGVEAVCVSCKRGGAGKNRLLSHLEEFDSRAKAIGGQFTRRWIAVCHPPSGAAGVAVQRRSQELGIKLLSPSDLTRTDPFA